MTTREALIEMAKISEQCERYNDMTYAMRKVVELGDALSVEERNLLSVAYKNNISTKRFASRVLSSLAEDTSKNANDALTAYLSDVNEEFESLCSEILNILDNQLIVSEFHDDGSNISMEAFNESKVFYLKMKGDYHRYLTEIASGENRQSLAEASEKAYNQASELSITLPGHNPVRLGLALNHSVLYYEVLHLPQKACNLASKAFEEAITAAEGSSRDSYQESTLIMELLRDNITTWNSEIANDKDEDQDN